MKLTPYLHFAGNAEDVLNFYKGVFNGELLMVSRYGDSPMPVDDDWKNKIIHSRLAFGDNLIMISDAFKGQPVTTGGNIQLSVEMEDVTKLEDTFNQLAADGNVVMPLQKQFWGATFGMVNDKFGISWMFNSEDKEQ